MNRRSNIVCSGSGQTSCRVGGRCRGFRRLTHHAVFLGPRRCRARENNRMHVGALCHVCGTDTAGRCRGGSRTAPTTGAARCLRCSLAQRTRLHARHVGATRCVALAPLCTSAPHEPTRSQCTRRTQWATHRVALTLPAGGAQDRMCERRPFPFAVRAGALHPGDARAWQRRFHRGRSPYASCARWSHTTRRRCAACAAQRMGDPPGRPKLRTGTVRVVPAGCRRRGGSRAPRAFPCGVGARRCRAPGVGPSYTMRPGRRIVLLPAKRHLTSRPEWGKRGPVCQ